MDHDFARLESALAGTAFQTIRYAPETGSTNEDAAVLLGEPLAAGVTIVADYQQRGAGRKGRSWVARPGAALLFTTILPHEIPTGDLWIVPFWTALAVGAALRRSGIETQLHWPNDLLFDGKKLCGILCISRIAGERAWVGCGVGINLKRWPDADAIVPPPAFCDDSIDIDRATLLASILLEFDRSFDEVRDPANVARRWERAAGLPGAPYRILRDGEINAFEARAVALDGDGALIVERNGQRETIALADARALR
jgi:BirA family biotin operon repressor/biotin-[acetyl-CoA-carboxylase] ligase